LFLKIPEGFESKYSDQQVLKLNQTIYGLKQAAQAFWMELVRALKVMGFERSKGDPCCYVKTVENRVIICLSWVDDCMFMGTNRDILQSKSQIMQYFECHDVGYTEEYVGCKIEVSDKKVKFTQPVLVKSFRDEFDAEEKGFDTPLPAGQTLQFTECGIEVNRVKLKKYQAGVGKLLYLARWSRPDICNSVRELLRFASRAQEAHVKAMKRVMNYYWETRNRGLALNPNGKWTGKLDGTKFVIRGKSDFDYAKDMETQRSVSGYCVFLNGAPVGMKSRMQDSDSLHSRNPFHQKVSGGNWDISGAANDYRS
jgi:Reverse transcriptase (RNA-dependent DNA polymerase)